MLAHLTRQNIAAACASAFDVCEIKNYFTLLFYFFAYDVS